MPNCEDGQHKWSRTGLWHDGYLCIPCLAPTCAAYLRRWADRWVYVPQGFGHIIGDIALDIEDDPSGGVAKLIYCEITSSYKLTDLDLHPGDVVIDIGAHVGIVSIYLAKRYPGICVLAYEPQPENYGRLIRNVIANEVVGQVVPHNVAVTDDGRDVLLRGDGGTNSGGWSMLTGGPAAVAGVRSTTLPDIFAKYHLDRVAVLKIDCEGAEYEILTGAEHLLDRVDYLAGEFHDNAALQAQYGGPAALLALCQRHLPDERLRITNVKVGG